ncbi:MAG TPA: hypothetical protein PKD38_18975 [Nitrospira sp.]|nr:hypothetical protein [Nitrospira sp.]HNA87354.1 hypothetical protein [Nitrospira sp.]
MTSRSAMGRLLSDSAGDVAVIMQRRGIPPDQWNEPLVRIDVMNPLLHYARLPSGLNSGANSRFQWGGFTSGGMPELVTNPIQRKDTRAKWKGQGGSQMYVVEFAVKPGTALREGTVGPMFDKNTAVRLPGGGHQVQFVQSTPYTTPSNFVIDPKGLRAVK